MDKDIQELITICEKQIRHWEVTAKQVGITKTIGAKFPNYYPMRKAVKDIKEKFTI